jgi:hypothetical protein
MPACEADTPTLIAPCPSQGRWVGPDGKVRCSLHQVMAFGHSAELVRVENYEPPADAPPPPSPPNGGSSG